MTMVAFSLAVEPAGSCSLLFFGFCHYDFKIKVPFFEPGGSSQESILCAYFGFFLCSISPYLSPSCAYL